MAVRKIPLKERPAVRSNGPSDQGHDDEDPEVPEVLSTIRSIVLKDRALHDKVRKIHVPTRVQIPTPIR